VAQEDYLRALLALTEGEGPVPTSVVAERMGVNPASVSEMFTKLAGKDLIVHDRYRGATLTRSGSAIAVEITRHHRILETFLVEILGYTWDEVHDEADRLEHAISEKLEQRMWEALGQPRFDPHGDEIPAHDGSLRPLPGVALHEAREGEPLRVTRISDRDSEKLRALREMGIGPGSVVRVREASRWEGSLTVEILRAGSGSGEIVQMPLGLARVTFVEAHDG
jgi:DtxR family Mn-dependent transcriptional regulator